MLKPRKIISHNKKKSKLKSPLICENDVDARVIVPLQ
jgi:hypothetical protein